MKAGIPFVLVAVMKIVLIRHFKVGFKWKFLYNAEEYEVDCAGYNAAAVIKMPLNIDSGDKLITSTMGRALETSRLIFARDPDLSDDMLCEVPIKPFLNTKLRFPKIIWDILGRIQWRLNLKPQPETFRQSKERVNRLIDSLVAEKQNVIIVCHGWIIKLIVAKLKSAGFRGPSPVFIKNGVPYEYILPEKKQTIA